MIYTGIGARNTPADILTSMTNCAYSLALRGWTLRSGGANGADTAFEKGAKNKEIYLPWRHFNGNTSPYYSPTNQAFVMARDFHPAWDKCSNAARQFHARNCHQVLGLDLQSPTDLVLCWTPKGEMVGGTAQALRIAEHHNIPIINLAWANWLTKLKQFIGE
jgi:hypothetical protein